MKPDYYFASTGGGTVGGFNNPLAANFAYEGDLTGILVREAIQNIVDAKLPTEATVRAEFDLDLIPAEDLPRSEHLGDIFSKCADYADNKNTIPASKHFRAQAKTIRENNTIPLLKISDYNTCGLEGDHENGRWFNLMRGVGINSGSAGEGGAFGLGKGAFFANSLFKTIFVTSITDDGIKFAGKSMLTSFEQNGDIMQENGTFGQEGQIPVTNLIDIPEIFNKRVEKGTDIWVVNYIDSQNWEENIFRAVLGWFWPAIHWGLLTVRIGNKDINRDNLRERMSEYYSVDDNITQKPFNPLHFFDAYTNPEKKLEREVDNLKTVNFFGQTSDQLPLSNKTALIRNTGMVIDFIAKMSPVTKYVAVIECRNDIGGPILRKLENPSHTEWKPNNWKDEYGNIVETGRAAMNEIRFVLDLGLSKLLFTPGEQSTVIPGLTDYLGTPSADNNTPEPGGVNNLVIEPVDEETGMEVGIDGENPQGNKVRIIPPIRVGTPVPGGRVRGGGGRRPHDPNPHVPPTQPGEPPIDGQVYVELKDAVIRYVVGDQTSNGRIYSFVIHADSISNKVAVRLRLYARSEEGEGGLLEIRDCLGTKGTEIIKTGVDYCDLYLNDLGKANLSVELKETWTVALDPTLKIKI